MSTEIKEAVLTIERRRAREFKRTRDIIKVFQRKVNTPARLQTLRDIVVFKTSYEKNPIMTLCRLK